MNGRGKPTGDFLAVGDDECMVNLYRGDRRVWGF